MKRMPTRRVGPAVIVALLLAALTGCGPARPKTVAVDGRVLFDGQRPPQPGMVYFAPLEPAAGYPRRPGRAAFDADGRFRATSFNDGDGLVPGRYRVAFDCWASPPKAEGLPSKGLVPPPYDNPGTSPLELVVKPDAGSLTVEFDLRK